MSLLWPLAGPLCVCAATECVRVAACCSVVCVLQRLGVATFSNAVAPLTAHSKLLSTEGDSRTEGKRGET
jgi:hypothetical protein